MLGTYIDIILYPVRELLQLLVDPRLTEHLGVSVLGIAVSSAIVLIVVTALVTRINAGDLANSVISVVSNKDREHKLDSERAARSAAADRRAATPRIHYHFHTGKGKYGKGK